MSFSRVRISIPVSGEGQDTMIEVSSLSKIYRKGGIRANDGISFAVSDGEILCLLGPTGSGKTTLVKILATLILPSSGRAAVNGFDVVLNAKLARRSIGLSTGQERSFYYRLTGRQNLEFFGALRGMHRRDLAPRIRELLEQFGLWSHRNREYMKYSSGMKKMLSLARAMLTRPSTYLLDEPTTGVDPLARERIHDMITRIRDSGQTVLLTTHDMEEAAALADQIAILASGKLIHVGSPDELGRLLPRSSIILEFGEQPVRSACLDGLRGVPGVAEIVVEDDHVRVLAEDPHSVFDAVIRCVQPHCVLTGATVQRPSLRDAFLHLATRDIGDE